MTAEVDHPSHYCSDPSGIECIEITRHRNFNVGNAIKYLWRAGLKDADTTVQDLEKAVWYIRDEIGRLSADKIGKRRVALKIQRAIDDDTRDPLDPCKTCAHESCGSRCGHCEDCDSSTGGYPGWESRK